MCDSRWLNLSGCLWVCFRCRCEHRRLWISDKATSDLPGILIGTCLFSMFPTSLSKVMVQSPRLALFFWFKCLLCFKESSGSCCALQGIPLSFECHHSLLGCLRRSSYFRANSLLIKLLNGISSSFIGARSLDSCICSWICGKGLDLRLRRDRWDQGREGKG